MIRVVVVSPLPSVRAGLRAMIGPADDCDVVGELDRLRGEAAGLPAGRPPDVVVVDPEADFDPSDVLTADGAVRGPAPVILGPFSGDDRLSAVLGGRAWGYLPRDAGGDALVAAIRAVAAGLLAIDPSFGSHLLTSSGLAGGASPSGDVEELTTREREVLELVAIGLANKVIANQLAISEHTVKFHVAAILAKLGAGSRTEAVHVAARRGMVTL